MVASRRFDERGVSTMTATLIFLAFAGWLFGLALALDAAH
jgi:hypothetical protein